MAEQIDVYREWLGIQETTRPLNYYQLLRVPQFCDDAGKIRAHYRKMNAHVRKYASGDYAQQSQQLLNELAKAMLCLTDLQRKREYDASLGRETEEEGRRRSLEEILLLRKVVDRDQLNKARSYADAVGLEIRDAVVQQKMAAADVVMLAYAESLGLPYIELADIGVDEQVVPQIPPTIARQHSCVPVMIDKGVLLMASPNPLIPDVEEELRLRLDMPVRTVLCTAGSVNAAVAEHFPRDAQAAAPVKQKKPAKQAAAKQAPEPREEREPLTLEEKQRRRNLFAVVGFNITVIVVMALFMVVRGGMSMLGMFDFIIAVFLAVIVAGATIGTMTVKDL